MTNWRDESVLIVGGGIGGLTAALALERHGIPSQVIEQASEFKEIGAGIQLGPNVFWMLDRLGLIAPVSALAVFPNNLIMRDSITGEEVTRIPLGDAFRNKFHHPYALIHRADLHRVLLDACRKSSRIRLDALQKVVKVDETDGGVAVATESGKDYRGAALIGADGLWSTIRQMIVGDGKPKPAGHITYRAVLPTAAVPEQYRWQDMAFWAGEKVHLVLYPLRTGELFNLVAVFHSNRYEEGWDSFGDPAELHERFAQTCEPVRTLLSKIESWRMWVLCDRPPIKDWSAAASRSSATPRIRCCNTWRKAPVCRSKTRCVSPTRRWRRTAITPPHSAPISKRAICAPAACKSWRASMASSTTPQAWRRSCAT